MSGTVSAMKRLRQAVVAYMDAEATIHAAGSDLHDAFLDTARAVMPEIASAEARGDYSLRNMSQNTLSMNDYETVERIALRWDDGEFSADDRLEACLDAFTEEHPWFKDVLREFREAHRSDV